MEPKMKLVRRTGEKAEYPLDAEVIHLGRERARTIPINDPQVSRHHAEITCAAEGRDSLPWVITDLGSTNGTYVNETLLTGSRPLHAGDRIRLGNTVFSYEAMEVGRRFRNVVAVLIALSTLVGALIAWRASLAWDSAAGARAEGAAVLIGLTQHQTEVSSSLYENLDAFTSYRWHLVMSGLIAGAVPQIKDSVQVDFLEEERLRQANMALAALDLVNLDYVQRAENPADQTFQRQRFVETNLAEVASQEDLDYQAHFQESDRESLVSRRLAVTAVLLSLSIFFYTAATLSKTRLKYVLAAAGGLLFSLGGLAAALVEVTARIG